MLCPVCGGAVYLNFPGVGTLRGRATALGRLQTLRVVAGQDLVTGQEPADCRWRMVEMATVTAATG